MLPFNKFRIQITGPSGIGKTTLAKEVEKVMGIDYISSSYHDLFPNLPKKHTDLMEIPKDDMVMDEYRLLSRRYQLYIAHNYNGYVTDRSMVDSIAYFIEKLAHKVAACETEDFITKAIKTIDTDCVDLIIFLPFTKNHIKGWSIEDDNKRITNPYYQFKMSSIINSVIFDILSPELINTDNQVLLFKRGKVFFSVIEEMDLLERLQIVKTVVSQIYEQYHEADSHHIF